MFLLKRPIQADRLNLSSILVLGINWLGFEDLRRRPTCGLQKVSKGATLASQIKYRLSPSSWPEEFQVAKPDSKPKSRLLIISRT